jgi:nucleotide-binding universal stress UspA family protein
MDEQNRNTILVTWDNTEVSEYALLHAIRIGHIVDNSIRLVHVTVPGSRNPDKERKDFEAVVSRLSEQHGQELEGVVLKGKIFREISGYANDSDTSMVIMGTHGIKGVQKITGSWALKVIAGSTVPFIVVQDKPQSSEARYSSIVFPIDFKSENKEKLQWAIFLGKYFDSKIYLFKAPVNDKSLQKKVNVNLNFAMKFLIKNNLSYEIHTGLKSSRFGEETVEFAQKIGADMIIITTTKFLNFADYVLGPQEQSIIANNSKIPVMCVNPRASIASMGQFMFGSTQP